MYVRALFALILPAIAVGCGAPEPAVYEARGTLTINGVPVSNASLAFHCADGDTSAACPVGITNDDGAFALTTFAANDGAPPGEYVVTLLWHDASKPVDECECIDPTQHDLLRGRYADAKTSELRATIRRKPNQLVVEATAPRKSEEGQGVGAFFGPPPRRDPLE